MQHIQRLVCADFCYVIKGDVIKYGQGAFYNYRRYLFKRHISMKEHRFKGA